MTGEVIAVFNKGRHGSYGFIHDEEGNDRYFAAEELVGISIGDLAKHTRVEFTPTRGGRNNEGLRASQVYIPMLAQFWLELKGLLARMKRAGADPEDIRDAVDREL